MKTFKLVVVGASLGGLEALKMLLEPLPGNFPVPMAVVQHRFADNYGEKMDTYLQLSCRLPVKEAEDKVPLEPGHVYLAPADYHLLVEKSYLALSTEAPINHSRPSIDVLFETAATAYGDGVIGIILTGSSADGAKGVAAIKNRGGCVMVQEPLTAESPVMPRAAISATAIDRILPVPEIARLLAKL